ncbi:MAG: HDOD domain-containing protein [Motiliproteus sp.]
MKQSEKIFGLSNWVTFLKDKQLPVMARTVQQLNYLLQDPHVSLNRLVPVINTDPVFTMHLTRLANQLNKNIDTQVNTVALAVSTLGLTRIQNLCSQLPVMKINHASVAHKQYFQSLDNSYHASVQATALCRFPGASMLNDTRTAALFYGIGHWALWRYAPYQMSDSKVGIYEQHKDVVLAQNDALGCTIQQISEALVQEWSLSGLGVQALKHSTSPDAEMLEKLHRFSQGNEDFSEDESREIKLLLNSNYYPVKLANWLAWTVPYGWHKPKTLRLMEIISDFLTLPEDKTATFLHQNCVQGSREFNIDGIMGAAALMLLIPSDQVPAYRIDGKKPEDKNTAKISPSTAKRSIRQLPGAITVEDTFKDKEIFQKLVTKLLKQPELYSSEREIYVDLARGLKSGLGLERLSIFQVDENNLLVPTLQSGFADKAPMRRFTLSLNIPSLFKKLSHKSLAVYMADHNRDKIRAELPERFKLCAHQKSFVLMSLFKAGQPVAYIYADHGDAETPVSEFFFKYFKYICGAASTCINKD